MKQSKSVEQWASNVFGDVMSNGWNDAIKGLFRLFIKLSASTVLAFLHYRTGTRFISGATLFWGYTLVGFFYIFDVLFGSANSMQVFNVFNLAFAAVACYRIFESRRNLRRADGKGKMRYGGDIGLSYLWPPFKNLVSSIGILPKDGFARHWWQLDEFKFQRFVEPALLFIIGTIFQNIGYGAFGFYIILSSICTFLLLQQLEDNYYETKQETWDAKVLSRMVQGSNEPQKREMGMVAQQALMRSDNGFEAWKKEQEEKSRLQENNAPLRKAA